MILLTELPQYNAEKGDDLDGVENYNEKNNGMEEVFGHKKFLPARTIQSECTEKKIAFLSSSNFYFPSDWFEWLSRFSVLKTKE